MKKYLIPFVFLISLFFSCGFKIDDLIFDYNANFDQTPIIKFISNGQINSNAIIQEEKYEVKKTDEGGQNFLITAPVECETFAWKISPNISDEFDIKTNSQSLVLPIDLLQLGIYNIYVTVSYKSYIYDDSCTVEIY